MSDEELTESSDSILTSIKKLIGLAEDYTAFDMDIIIQINSAFATLNQLGVGPDDGFSISDSGAVWTDFVPDSPVLSMVKTYIYLRVRVVFDPPSTAAVLEAFNSAIKEQEWRLNVFVDPAEDEGEEE